MIYARLVRVRCGKRGNDKRKTMMRKRNMFRYVAVLGSAAVLWASVSCSTDDSDVYDKAGKTDDAPVMLRVVSQVSGGDIQVNTRAEGGDKYLLDERLWRFISNDAFKDDTTRIRIRVVPGTADAWNFGDNYYEYIYSKALEDSTRAINPDTIYNFKPWTNNKGDYKGQIGPGMTWSQLTANAVNNSTNVYAALYAKTYSRDSARVISPVQITANNIIGNDVLLAYHSVGISEFTAQYFTLQLYHVYSMLAVEVHVPIYDPSDGLGFRETPTGNDNRDTLRIDRSGVPDHVLTADSPIQKLEVINQRLTVSFEEGQADDYPSANVVNGSGDEAELQNVEMCLMAVAPPEDDSAYTDKGFKMQKYLYACILPASDATATASSTTLRLTIKNAVSGVEERYTCSTFSPVEGTGTGGGTDQSFTLRQGWITLACLKLDRRTNELVLVKGKVLPWGTASAELGLVENGPGDDNSRPDAPRVTE